ncbi:MAG: DUF3772 domain-containing protein [Chromatiales bacterium]
MSCNSMFQSLRSLSSALLLLGLVAGGIALAADIPLEEGFRHLATRWDRTLKAAESELTGSLSAEQAEALRKKLDAVRAEAQTHGRAARRKGEEINALIAKLGPAPEAGAVAEGEEISKKRVQLNGALADLSGQVKQADLTIARTDALFTQISAAQFERRTTDLLVRQPPPTKPATWRDATRQTLTMIGAIHAKEVVAGGRTNLIVLPLVAFGIYVALVAGRLLRRRIQQRWGRDPAILYPSYGRRLVAAVIEGVSRGLIPVLVIAILLAALWWLFVQRFVDPSLGAPLLLLYAVAFYLVAAALVRAAFSPEQPNWRITPVTAQASEKIGRRLNLLAAVFAVDMAVSALFHRFGEPPELSSLHSFAINLLLATLLLSLTRTKLWQVENIPEWFEERPRVRAPALSSYFRFILGVVAVTAIGCNVLGYAALADYLLRTIILTVLMVSAMFALRFVVREVCARLLIASAGPAQAVKRALGLSDQGGRAVSFWSLALIDLLLIFAGVFLALAFWGIPPRDVADWVLGLFRGFAIGTHHFSLTDVFLAILFFGGIVVVTRLVQHFLEFRLFPNTSLDIGIRTAIASGIGYIGVGVAVLAAISTLGINLTGLAVVAGALSVGIGFGLQNVVNNFISGIILLIERPVKVGDTVVVKEHEGVVRRIKVRSTEIETGLHASVIIPNSDLLQSAVLNWTHRDRTGRVEIRVVAPYSVETSRIEAILMQCARAHPQVILHPEPTVLLVNFTDRGAEYQLSFQLEDLDNKGRVSSDVRKSILERLRAAGIEVPTTQKPSLPLVAPPALVAPGNTGGESGQTERPADRTKAKGG